MFTGIIADVGTVEAIRSKPYGARLCVQLRRLTGIQTSESVAVNGVCLTVVEATAGQGAEILHFDCVQETLDRTSLGALTPGARVNLERPIRAAEPMGGHFVQGHVDGKGRITGIEPDEAGRMIRVACEPAIMQLIVQKGSIALDGISLTVASCGNDSFSVAIIPFTWEETNLSDRRIGDEVNIETDILAKYIAKFLPPDYVPAPLRNLTEV